ncbi:RNA polymerase subunit sigma [Bdellovibrio bacteriovorus]|uniref:RNA polymerase subunit sigma n=1 Tax=Bdellovibrio bacteriovorus TaxID=959 RepID=A0A150WL91_BDEBC|nr:sigma-70 family RNA polymerase sigma factor [Bdellovibrio bacteriovorus]KYG64698.1 RNA polymerase subunit sigma [Bdellovibrio bacteriovorus]
MTKKLTEQTDEELLLSLAEGETKALDILFLRHSGRVLAYALKKGLSPERADDVLQIVFLQLHRKKHLYDPKHAALAWIYVITRSELKDYRNREIKDFKEWDDSLSQTAEMAPMLETKDEALGLLSGLREKDQEIVKMRYLDEMEYAEIAKVLNESEGNIRQIVSRSLRLLRGRS